ncbi:uncharacterized protein K489DRAFT_62868 [Dissoconium aciculare CBS 342.82]|uniref:Uncharacterized protein n=1 Tax=Dissoconium aciculare CBS 342.82 TaxID=1314786 RepID=A0A6J3LW10_9PEZI|nr:uncharacterized protein K489DRAFT_62868 [Dissoconium aciculare CBS 342.82]KAF1819961.1 hypothetical protein K489DRAFT_62868 [Dissoconium aciculare CBS 342.82]
MPTEYIGDDIVPGLRKYDTSGITIQWADIYDAQFAAEWPKDVKHVPMGILRHTPPAPTHASVTDTLDSRQIYRDGHPLADGPAHDMATFKASQWRRTRGVPTETTPVNFAHPKDSSQTAPWLQTDDTDALEALRARQRAWNATHAPRKDTWEPFSSTDQPSTPNASADQPTNSYQAAIARKEKLARLQKKLIDKTLPDVDTSNEPSVKLVMSTPRITNLNAFRDLPQTVLALRAAASARAAKREAEREALRQSMAEEEATRQLGDEERAARKQEADLVRQKAEEEKARDPEAFEAARAARRAAREEAYLAERDDAPARAVKREAALQLKAMRQAAAEKQRVRMQAARELQTAARQKAHAALLEARAIGKEKRLEETAVRRLQEQKIKEQKARDAEAFEATRAARRMARNAAKNSKPSKVARQAMRKEAYLARQAAEK